MRFDIDDISLGIDKYLSNNFILLDITSALYFESTIPFPHGHNFVVQGHSGNNFQCFT